MQGYGLQAKPGQAVSFGSTPDITGLQGVTAENRRKFPIRKGVISFDA